MSFISSGMAEPITPFEVRVSDDQIATLRARLAGTLWPDQLEGSGWAYGVDGNWLRSLCAYWQEGFDWRAFEARLNAWPQFRTVIDGLDVHFYHIRSPHPAAKPLLISHGWPSTPAEFLKVIGPLTDPLAHGGKAADAFHLVIPSLPGFGFSGPTRREGVNSEAIARAFAGLMGRLGYQRYFAQGGDKGVLISMMQAALFTDRVEAIHITLAPGIPDMDTDAASPLAPTEIAFLERAETFQREEAGYQLVQRMKPLTLAYGLTDSPVALAAWLVDKYRAWSDCGGDVEHRFSRDQLLETISIYWLTGTIASSMRIYFEDHAPGRQQPLPRIAVPTGHSHFPAEIVYTPRRWAERRFDIRYWREMTEGGHFPAAEVPRLFIGELREFFRAYR